MYRPEVCYDEYIYKKEPNQPNKPENKPYDKFVFTKLEPNKVSKDTILTTVVRIKNESTNEDAENFALKTVVASSQEYIQGTTYLVPNINTSTIMNGPKGILKNNYYNKDNTKLQKLNGNELTFFLGQGSNTQIKAG